MRGPGFASPGDEGSLYIPPAILHDGWGEEGSVHVVEEKLPLPNRMSVLSYSFLEDRFYEGTFALPVDSITRLFRKGYRSYRTPGGHDTYDVLAVGVAPGGAVAVWATGSERQVEVFFAQAEAAELDWHRAMQAPPDVDRNAYVQSELESAAELDTLVRPMMARVPVGRWATYRARYHWRPVFEGVGAPMHLERAEFVNGERDDLVLADLAGEQAGRPAPRFFIFADPDTGARYRPSFDEEEITAAFTRASAGGRPVELVFTGAPDGRADPQVLVRGGSEPVPLQHVTYIK